MFVRLHRTCAAAALVAALLANSGCGTGFVAPFFSSLLIPWDRTEATPKDLGYDYEELTVPTQGGYSISLWHVPSPRQPARATVLLFTGAQGNIERYVGILAPFLDAGYNTCIFDWQGFGASEGEPNVAEFDTDTNAVIDYLLSRDDPASHRIVYYGISLGATVAIPTAVLRPDPCIGLMLDSPFVPPRIGGAYAEPVGEFLVPLGNLVTMALTADVPRELWVDPWVPHLEKPVIMVVNRDDELTPPSSQLDMFEKITAPKTLHWSIGTHAKGPELDPAYFPTLIAWCDALPGVRPAPPELPEAEQ